MARVAIVSLRFNPAFIQFLIAYAKAFRELGHEPSFVVDQEYRRFPEIEAVAPILDSSVVSQSAGWTHGLFLNPAVENRELADRLKKLGVKVLYVFHEPWQIDLGYLRTEGLAATARVMMAHRATVPVLKLADTVMLASRYGLRMYEKKDRRFNPNAVYFPLIMDDEAPENIAELLPGKRYFGFIGNPCRSHGFDQYVSFMRHSLSRGLDIEFLIASRFPLPASFMKEPLFRNQAKIEIRCGRALNNEEMNRCYAESFCIWNLYRRTTQSAVLPKAFMFGTPILANDVGSFPEFVEEGENGHFARAEDHDGLVAALEDIRKNLAVYAERSRDTFREVFYYRSRVADLEQLMGGEEAASKQKEPS